MNPKAVKTFMKQSHLHIKRVNIVKSNKRLLTVLDRDIEFLMKASSERQLTEDESRSLIAYLKLIRDLRKLEEDDSKGLSDEDLKGISSVGLGEK